MSYAYDRPGLALPELTPAIKRLMLVNLAVFLLNAVLGGRLSDRGGFFAFSWSNALEGYGLGLLRLVSYQFTHSFGDVFHILMNMLVLYFFGTMAERSLGYLGTIKVYLLAGVVAALAHLLVAAPQGYADVPLVGASGSCYAFLVYAACMAPRAIVLLLFFPIPLGWLAGGLVFIGLYATYAEFVTGFQGGVAHSAHLGGAAFGFLAHRRGWCRDYTPWVRHPGLFATLRQRFSGFRARRAADRAAAEQRELDRLLEKVHRSGLQSLSGAERRFLDRQSRRGRR